MSHSPDSLLGTLVRKVGYERSSAKLLQMLEQRLLDEGIATYPELADPSNTHRTRIYFSDCETSVPGYQLPGHLFDEER